MVIYRGKSTDRRKPRRGISVECDGIRFDSRLERDFYLLLKQSNHVKLIETHKPLRFYGTARALELDFVIHRHDGVIFYADTKAFWTITQTFKFKRQILEQQMGIYIDIVLRNRAGKNRVAIDELSLYIRYIETTEKNIGFNRWKSMQ